MREKILSSTALEYGIVKTKSAMFESLGNLKGKLNLMGKLIKSGNVQ